MPAVEERRCQHIFERTQILVQIGVHKSRQEQVEGTNPRLARCRPTAARRRCRPCRAGSRDGSAPPKSSPRPPRNDGWHGTSRSRRGETDGEASTSRIGDHQQHHRLQPRRQRRQRAMAAVVESESSSVSRMPKTRPATITRSPTRNTRANSGQSATRTCTTAPASA